MRPIALAMALSAALLAAPIARAEPATPLTEDQARSRIEATGYTQVTGLHADARGLWRARAARNGDPCEVSLDAQGNLEDSRELAALTMLDRETAEAPAPGLVVQVSR